MVSAEGEMQRFLEQRLTFRRLIGRNNGLPGRPIGFIASLFGCWHEELSRPFTDNEGSYRVCLECGARRMFDTESFKTLGRFYYAPFGGVGRN
jgi:hypothetical protein